MMQSQTDFEMPKADVSYGMAYAVSLDANCMTVEASNLTWGEAALTAMSRRVGFEMCTSTTIATPRAQRAARPVAVPQHFPVQEDT